jgi:signal transduction histidine kinase
MLRELEEQQRAIDDSYRELREAHRRISDQAKALERVDSIGRELSKDVDLDRVLDGLVRVLTDELGFVGVELWLSGVLDGANEAPIGGAPPLRRIRLKGATEPHPLRRHELTSAGRSFGELVVYLDHDADPGDATDLLDLLLPWIALAIDNAQTYARLERHAEALEQRVRERTARLLAVNHHLVREIDERKRATDALLQSEAQLRASERLASIGTLASGIAHEINNPVGAILAAAQLAQIMRSDAAAAPQVDAALVDIVAEAKRCGDIVRGVLQFAREERTDKWACSLRDLVFRSIRLTSAFAEQHGARLVPEVPEVSPWAHANPTQLEQAIVNLVRNSIESGATTVRVALRDQPDDRTATIEIRDDGIGISESERLRILEPFYTTRRASGGTGLGLSVVHGIALEHGGSLAIESIGETGSSIVLRLPCIDPPAPREPDILEKPPAEPVEAESR